MEKGEFLDIADKKGVSSKKSEVRLSEDRSQTIRGQTKVVCPLSLVLCFLFSVLCFLSSGCSLPRIIVLDDPLTPEEHINLGVAYEKKGDLDNAIEEFKKASKKLHVAYLYLGNAYMQKGDPDEAEKYYKKAIKKQPDLADAYNNLAWLYYNKAKGSGLTAEDINEIIKEAERLALKALELSPSNENYKDTLNKIRELKSKNGL
ncbi:MAG: tetratricopeptide repeat protein [Nitrospirota bacterium]